MTYFSFWSSTCDCRCCFFNEDEKLRVIRVTNLAGTMCRCCILWVTSSSSPLILQLWYHYCHDNSLYYPWRLHNTSCPFQDIWHILSYTCDKSCCPITYCFTIGSREWQNVGNVFLFGHIMTIFDILDLNQFLQNHKLRKKSSLSILNFLTLPLNTAIYAETPMSITHSLSGMISMFSI